MHYDGGKGGAGVFQWIINEIPPHAIYIELFLGAGRVLRNKLPAGTTIGVEVDPQVLDQLWTGAEVPNLQLVCEDALVFLRRYAWHGDEFLYLDPPYLLEARSSQRNIYRHEFATIEEHQQLLAVLKTLPCRIAISGYWSPLYASELATWRTTSFRTVKRSGRPATEWLWMNYSQPHELHDYRYLGRGFRERERIKRKRERWKQRIRNLPTVERFALFAAISEVRVEALPTAAHATFGDGFEGIAQTSDAAW